MRYSTSSVTLGIQSEPRRLQVEPSHKSIQYFGDTLNKNGSEAPDLSKHGTRVRRECASTTTPTGHQRRQAIRTRASVAKNRNYVAAIAIVVGHKQLQFT